MNLVYNERKTLNYPRDYIYAEVKVWVPHVQAIQLGQDVDPYITIIELDTGIDRYSAPLHHESITPESRLIAYPFESVPQAIRRGIELIDKFYHDTIEK
jgi:hypothetical protein